MFARAASVETATSTSATSTPLTGRRLDLDVAVARCARSRTTVDSRMARHATGGSAGRHIAPRGASSNAHAAWGVRGAIRPPCPGRAESFSMPPSPDWTPADPRCGRLTAAAGYDLGRS